MFSESVLQWIVSDARTISDPLIFVSELGKRIHLLLPHVSRFHFCAPADSRDIGLQVWTWTRDSQAHPATSAQIRARSLYDSEPHAVEEILLDHKHRRSEMFRQSPFHHVISTGNALRRPLRDPDCPIDFPVLSDLRKEGTSDYMAVPLLLSTGKANAISLCTDHPKGFSEKDADFLQFLSAAVGMSFEVISLRRKTDFERRLLDMKVDFMSTVAHEFRTPISTIMVAADTLSAHSERMNSEQVMTRTMRIKEACERLGRLVDEVIETGDSNHAQHPLRLAPLHLRDLTQESVKNVQKTTKVSAAITITYEGPELVVMDLGSWRAITGILIENAVKFSRGAPIIDVMISVDDESIRLEVADKGIGIPAEEIHHVLSPFYRASNAKHTSGVGLGLTILNTRLGSLGGSISFQSSAELGTTALVTLPHMALSTSQSEQGAMQKSATSEQKPLVPSTAE